jgi:hypothetical protein
MVPPRSWTKVAHNVFVFHDGNTNSWVEYSAGNFNFGGVGRWGIHRGPFDQCPKSWKQVQDIRWVKLVDIRS